MDNEPRVVVFSSLFPSSAQPGAGLFVRERMFRVARRLPISVVSPVPWFPFQSLLRRLRPGSRPDAPRREVQDGVQVEFPRFFSVPGMLKSLDGLWMALCVYPLLRRMKRQGRLDLIDAHFAYPDGYAATLVGRWLGVPVTVTLRGTEARHARDRWLAGRVRCAMTGARRVFAVSESLRQVAIGLGIEAAHVRVVGNGVDLDRFSPLPRAQARARLGLSDDAPVLITVGALVERKGFHRVMSELPELRRSHPNLTYLVVGGPSPEGDWSEHLRDLARSTGIEDAVRFLGPLSPDELRVPLSAADVFVLSTRNEGWANVLLEAMACGLPVVVTDVGGNAEVVCDGSLGIVVPFGDETALSQAIRDALARDWDRSHIRAYAARNTWDVRVAVLVDELRALRRVGGSAAARSACGT